MEGLLAFEDSFCQCGCGLPRSQAWDPLIEDNLGEEHVTCHARVFLDRKAKEREGGPPQPGVMYYPVVGEESLERDRKRRARTEAKKAEA